MPKVVVVGQGYVGLPLAMEAAKSGYTVVGLEADENKVAKLRASNSYIEDVADVTLQTALAAGNYVPSSTKSSALFAALKDFDYAVITVPTPLKEGQPDLTYVKEAAQMLAPYLEKGREQVVVLESTTYPGTTEEVLIPILEEAGRDSDFLVAGTDFHVGFSPERIDPGNQTWTLKNTPKIVAGLTEVCLAKVQLFYESIVDTVVPVQDLKSAEMAKIIENTFRHVNIALVNELARLAHGLGINIHEALAAAATKPYGYMPFTPGPGVGGHCLPVDPLYLAHRVEQKLGVPSRFIDLAQDVNDHQPDYIVQRLNAGLNKRGKPVNGSSILVMGLAYKANTADVRETPATRVVELLKELGADLTLVDPWIDTKEFCGFFVWEESPHKYQDYDAIVVLTDHEVFRYSFKGIAERGHYTLDTRNAVKGGSDNVEAL